MGKQKQVDKPRIRPRFMQSWINDKSNVCKQVGDISARGNVRWLDRSGTIIGAHLLLYWSFIPNNETEWLSVKVSAWCEDERALLCKHGDSYQFKTRFEQKAKNVNWHNKREWQLNRYYLGLDIKPHYIWCWNSSLWIKKEDWIKGVRK